MINTRHIFASPLLKPLCVVGLGLSLLGCSQSDQAKSDHGHSHDAHDAHAEHEAHSDHHEEGKAHKDEAHESKAADHKAHDTRSADSHIHGGATLSIAAEGKTIDIEFETPLFNLLGFEYEPQTPAEKNLVAQAEDALSHPENLIRFNSEAKCKYLPVEEKIELFDHHGEHEDEPEHSDDHHDDEHHDEDHHDGEDDDHEDSANHKDAFLKYQLTCKAIDRLKTIDVEFFNAFSNFSELELVYLGPSQQLIAELSPSNPSADLTR